MQNDYPLNTVIDGISNQDYHNHAAIGSSQCKNLLKSPWHFEYNRKHPKPPTAAMQFGSLVHQLVLEPQKFEQNYFVAEKPKKTTKEGKAMYAKLDAERGRRIWVTTDDFLKAEDMRHNLSQNDLVKVLLQGGRAEQAVFWVDNDTGILCKAKADYLNVEKGLIIDLKTTANIASEICFRRTTAQFQYHLSAALYQDGFQQATGQRLDFFIVAIESFAPHNYAIYKLSDELLAQGRSLYTEALIIYQAADNVGDFAVPYYQGRLVELVA